MVLSIFNTAKDNCIEKLRNPFFGTFITILILQNWQLVYSLFTFDYNITQQNKIDIINHLITCDSGWLFPSYWGILFKGAISSIIALLISYIILSGTAFLSNFYDSIVHPWIINKATKGEKIVIIEKYETLHKNFKQIKKDLDNEKEDNAKSLKNLETLEAKKDAELEQLKNEKNIELAKLGTEKDSIIEKLKNEKNIELAKLRAEKDGIIEKLKNEKNIELAKLRAEKDDAIEKHWIEKHDAIAKLTKEKNMELAKVINEKDAEFKKLKMRYLDIEKQMGRTKQFELRKQREEFARDKRIQDFLFGRASSEPDHELNIAPSKEM